MRILKKNFRGKKNENENQRDFISIMVEFPRRIVAIMELTLLKAFTLRESEAPFYS